LKRRRRTKSRARQKLIRVIYKISSNYVTLQKIHHITSRPRLSPGEIDKNGSQCDEQPRTDRKTQFLELFFTIRDSNPLKKPWHGIMATTVSSILDMNELFQCEAVSIFLMAHMKTLVAAQIIDWDAIGQRVKDDILQALTRDHTARTNSNRSTSIHSELQRGS
jgi:hypothetical protein